MIGEIKKEINKAIEDGQPFVYNEVLEAILDKYNNQPDYKTISQIAKMISSGEIPKEVYDKYLGDCPIGFMNYGDLLKYLTNNQQTLVTLKDFENVSNNLIDYKSAWEHLKKNIQDLRMEIHQEWYLKEMQIIEDKYHLGE